MSLSPALSASRCSADLAGTRPISRPDKDRVVTELVEATRCGVGTLGGALSSDYRIIKEQWLHGTSVVLTVEHATSPKPFRISIEEIQPPLTSGG